MFLPCKLAKCLVRGGFWGSAKALVPLLCPNVCHSLALADTQSRSGPGGRVELLTAANLCPFAQVGPAPTDPTGLPCRFGNGVHHAVVLNGGGGGLVRNTLT